MKKVILTVCLILSFIIAKSQHINKHVAGFKSLSFGKTYRHFVYVDTLISDNSGKTIIIIGKNKKIKRYHFADDGTLQIDNIDVYIQNN